MLMYYSSTLFFTCCQVVGKYDGHRVDGKTGEIVIAREFLKFLYQKYGVSNVKFQSTHCIGLGQKQASGLAIDGYPLCDTKLDGIIEEFGYMQFANSGSHSKSNVEFIWARIPSYMPYQRTLTLCRYLPPIFLTPRILQLLTLIPIARPLP